MTAVCAAALLVASPVFAVTIVADGDFSIPPGGASYTTINSGNTFGPWSVDSGSIDLIGGYWQSPTMGGGSVDLDGNSPGSISQTVALTAGKTYKLMFSLSGNPDGPPVQKAVTVSVGGFTHSYDYTIGANTHADMMYAVETAVFTADASQTLSFASGDSSTPYGGVIGGVSISAVPEPATWAMMLIGFAGLGFAGYRSSKRLETNSPTA